ncbi:MAG: calcium/sodium antiporter [archaeon]|nr:calcium/sodium antiporter [archaeon]
MVFIELALFAAGLLVLVRSSDIFVESAARLAKLFGISAFVIGLTIVAVGTSLPELATSIDASLKGESGIVVGTLIGSNIANIGLILGLFVLVSGSMVVSKQVFDKDLFLMLVATLVFFYFISDGVIGFLEGAVMFLMFVGYALFLLHFVPRFETIFNFPVFLKSFAGVGSFFLNVSVYKEILRSGISPSTYASLIRDEPDVFEKKFGKHLEGSERKNFLEKYKSEVLSRVARHSLLLLFSLAGVIVGADLLVANTIVLASIFGISSQLISLTIIAVGTSLPELSVSISAVRKGVPGIFLGNIIGSNIANLLLIGGLSAIVAPLVVPLAGVSLPLLFMILISVFFWAAVFGSWKLTRAAGLGLFLVYAAFIYLLAMGYSLSV